MGRRAPAAGPLVLSLTGEPLGSLIQFHGDRFSILTPEGRPLWLSAASIYIEHPLYVELICLRSGLGRYVVSPPGAESRPTAEPA